MLYQLGQINAGGTTFSGVDATVSHTGEGFAFFSIVTNPITSGNAQVLGRFVSTDGWTTLATLTASTQWVKVPLMPQMTAYGGNPDQPMKIQVKVLRTDK
jgi:hypothetical protein